MFSVFVRGFSYHSTVMDTLLELSPITTPDLWELSQMDHHALGHISDYMGPSPPIMKLGWMSSCTRGLGCLIFVSTTKALLCSGDTTAKRAE